MYNVNFGHSNVVINNTKINVECGNFANKVGNWQLKKIENICHK